MVEYKRKSSDLDVLDAADSGKELLNRPIGQSFADALTDETFDEAQDLDIDDGFDDVMGLDGADLGLEPSALDEPAPNMPDSSSFTDGLLADLEAEVAASARAIGEAKPTASDADLDDDLGPPTAPLFDGSAHNARSVEIDLLAADSFSDAPPVRDDVPVDPPAEIEPQAEVDPPMAYLDDPNVSGAGSGLGQEYDFTDSTSGDRAVPRVSIHAFCVRPATQTMLQSAANDRRMSNASMEVLTGGVEAAVQRYTAEATPNLIILECTAEANTVLSELDALAEHCDEDVKVIVIGLANDIRLYRELMRRGVSEYLVPPLDPVQLIRAVASLFVDPEQPFMGRNIAVCGVKGGVGASTLAHNFAWSVSERLQLNTTLVDLDLNFGTTGLDFNEEPAQSVADALMSPDRFDEAVLDRLISKATERLSLFTAPATLDRTFDLDPEVFTSVLDQVRKSVPFVVLDMPHIWTDWFKGTIVSADDILIVSGPDLASLRNGKNLIDFLSAARPNDNPPHLVLNMVGMPKRPEIPVKDFAQAMDMEPALVLPFEPQLFGTAANNGQMISDVAPDSKCAQGIDHLASIITGRDLQIEQPSLLSKLFKR